MDSSFNVISLCAGGGGLDLGFSLAVPNSRTVAYVEIDAFACEVLASAMEEGTLHPAPIWTDLKSFDGRPFRGLVDCILAGYPCQPFSLAGRRAGEDDPRHLWPHVARITQEVKPGIVLFENVSGHLSLGWDVVRSDIESMGYRVTAGLFTAEEVGAPHKRERLFILGVGNPDAIGRQGSDRGADIVAGGCESVADASSVRREGHPGQQHGGPAAQGRMPQSGTGSPELARGETSIHVFPPGPTDLEYWAAVLAKRPDLAPAIEPGIRGVADGLAPRVDQLRMLGNGVLPLEGAYALLSLLACHGGS